MRRTALSKKELQRGGVLARVKAGGLRLTDGAVLMKVSYRTSQAAVEALPGGWSGKGSSMRMQGEGPTARDQRNSARRF